MFNQIAMSMKKAWALSLLILFLCMGFTTKSDMKDTEEFMIYLKVKVLNEEGDPVHGAEVKVYQSMDDFDRGINALDTKYTNKNGKARFSGLHKEEYYVHVEKDNKDNENGQIKTDKLHNVSFNKETVIIY
jgi:putative lipoprotein (rSAM/lipoprotein system)